MNWSCFLHRKCPGCRKRHNWSYGVPIKFAGNVIPVIECENAVADLITFSFGQPMNTRTRAVLKDIPFSGWRTKVDK